MTKKSKNALIKWGFGLVVFLILFFFKQIDFEFGQQWENNKVYTPDQKGIVETLSGISLVTGELFSTPGAYKKFEPIIKSSKEFLNVWMYSITYEDFVKSLENLERGGTPVRMILEDKRFDSFDTGKSKSFPSRMKSRGVEIKNDNEMGSKYVHAKVFVNDLYSMISTANITFSSFEKNKEFWFVTKNSDINKSLKKVFERDWNGEKIEIADVHPNLLICPVDCREKMEYMLRSISGSLLIYNQYLSDPALKEIIKDKSHSGFRMILPDTDDNKEWLDYFGGSKVKLLKKPYVHAKIVIGDNKRAILSSINFSENSLDNNREIGIIITDPKVVQQLRDIFMKDWNS